MFLHAIIEEGIDTNGDSIIGFSEAEAADTLNISYKGVADLTGLEAFTNLIEFDCSRNQITSLDITENPELEKLYCWDNQLTNLDVSSNTSLTELKCDFNRLPALDVSKNTSLQILSCEVNPLRYLDVSNNTKLKILGCLDTQIRALDLSNNAKLEFLRCNFNPLSSLDVSKNYALRYLECLLTGLDRLDVSKNIDLAYLGCSFNQLSSLNVANNTLLEKLYCGYNQLTTLDISYNRVLEELYISGMPSLSEICVWTLPFPFEGVEVYAYDSPNLYFKDCIAPALEISETGYDPDYVEVTSSEDGVIYLVPEDTEKDQSIICAACIDSIFTIADRAERISVSGLEIGIYWLYARDATGNISDPEAFTILGIGIENTLAGQLRIFPNPTNDLLTIETDNPDLYSIEITSLNGQFIYRTRMDGNSHQIDLSSFQKGVYFITIRSKDFVKTEKIIKL